MNARFTYFLSLVGRHGGRTGNARDRAAIYLSISGYRGVSYSWHRPVGGFDFDSGSTYVGGRVLRRPRFEAFAAVSALGLGWLRGATCNGLPSSCRGSCEIVPQYSILDQNGVDRAGERKHPRFLPDDLSPRGGVG